MELLASLLSIIITMKTCSKCSKTKDLDDFHNCSSKKDGKFTWCKKCRNEVCHNYYVNNIDLVKEKTNIYYLSHKAERNKREKERSKVDILFKLTRSLRRRLRNALHRNLQNKTFSAVKDLGCTVEELKKHLESQFRLGMSWDNWGSGNDKWHIDHIRPLISASNEEELRLLSCYSNLQPLWAIDNIKKGDKIIEVED